MVEGEMAVGEFWQYEALINGFLDRRSGIVDSFIDNDLVAGLRQNLMLYTRPAKCTRLVSVGIFLFKRI